MSMVLEPLGGGWGREGGEEWGKEKGAEGGGGELVMLTKDADDAVRAVLAGGQERLLEETQAEVEDLAAAGLRTLLVAWRRVSRREVREWKS